MHGQGIMVGEDGEVIFEGIWEQGKSKTARKDLPEVIYTHAHKWTITVTLFININVRHTLHSHT